VERKPNPRRPVHFHSTKGVEGQEDGVTWLVTLYHRELVMFVVSWYRELLATASMLPSRP
jgi:hypothetical protein